VQALDIYADHYQRLYTADTFSIVAVKSYDYGGVRPTVQDDWYVGPENVRRHLWAWPDLWAVERSHAFEEAWDVWSQWLLRVKKGAWTLAKDRTLPTPMRYPVGASLGDGVLLMGYDLNVERVRPGETAELTLYWRCVRTMPADYTVFTHALDPGGLVRAQKDSQPLGGARPTHRWEVNEIVRDRYALTLDPASPPGSYPIEVGMYDANTGERLTVRDQAGVALPDKRALLGPIKVK
jgi:hypothetical protein